MWSLFRRNTLPGAPVNPPFAPPPVGRISAEPPPMGTDSPSRARLVALPENGRIRVVGESRYQEALRLAAHGRAAGNELDDHIPATAVLVPEPGNKADANAVRVDVVCGQRKLTVGYLPRELAAEYQPELLDLRRRGAFGTCPARIAGGGAKFYGIYLHLARPWELRAAGPGDPVVAASHDRTVLLRNDWFCTVTKEQDHQDVLLKFAPRRGQEFRTVTAQLGFCTISSGKYRGEPAIEVRLDGERVGQLTYAMSMRYHDRVKVLLDRGLEVTCEAVTKNTDKGIEIELMMPAGPRRDNQRRLSL
ncbi:HIRAN domain-containing protein [Amycolatopsis sp. NPDC059027]|uniref:HIRAN domain-containing protein n=1 Tax=Amycolatopsis sp. NPDC059027 TaxID=3346709 RepID=UPI00366E0232